jgi:hypothetical protein
MAVCRVARCWCVGRHAGYGERHLHCPCPGGRNPGVVSLLHIRHDPATLGPDPALAPTQSPTGRSTTRRLDSSYPDRALGRDIAYRVERLPIGMMLMYGAGLISALLGIGASG